MKEKQTCGSFQQTFTFQVNESQDKIMKEKINKNDLILLGRLKWIRS
jgi:hypothetical protein